jgi:small subunit ribosomal protein S17
MTTSPTTRISKPRTLQGEVVRRSGDKTVAVAVKSTYVHPRYNKRSTVTKKYLVHDPKNVGEVGQKVTIQEYRPMSARKRWILLTTPETSVS